MRARLLRQRRLLAIPTVLFGAAGALLGMVGLPLGATTACACQAVLPAFQLGPNNGETGGMVMEANERKEFTITNRTGEEVAIRSWVITNREPPMTVDEEAATANNPRCTPRTRLAVNALCYFLVVNRTRETGGEAIIKVEAENAATWRNEILVL